MKVEITKEQDISPRQDREILELQHLAFPESADFAHQRWYHTPPEDDLWFGVRRDGRLVAGARLLPRIIDAGEKELLIGGVANVCSHPDVRGSGAGKAVMQAVRERFQTEARFDFGLLFCHRDKYGFYARFGWQKIENETIIENPDGTFRRWDHNGVGYIMICPVRMPLEQWPTGKIDLNGPMW
ncbi:MAG: GNAT family N-acetyltransferase [Planctomycetota bacterium]|nr:GNAT family N-acetyltransferase [Planctomycetota bacterium]